MRDKVHTSSGEEMADQESELALVKMRLDQHDRQHEEVQESIKGLADGVKKLVEAEIRRENDGETFKRIFEEIEKIKTEIQTYRQQQIEKELKRYQGLIYRILGYGGLILASLIAGHFGASLI